LKAQGSTLAERLKSRRKELGLSQNALATTCGVSQPTIANWERGGHVPRQAALNTIATNLDIDPIWLISGEMPPDKNPAHRHILKPIYHIPVYDWPVHLADLETAQASDYMAMSLASGDMLAIKTSARNLNFPKGTILIFDKSIERVSGKYLAQSDGKAELVNLVLAANHDEDDIAEWDTYKPIGRLAMSIQPH